MNIDLNTAKSILERELKEATYVKDNPLGNAATDQKIKNYIIASIKENANKSDCLDWFNNLLKQNKVNDSKEYSCSDVVEFAYEILKRYTQELNNNVKMH